MGIVGDYARDQRKLVLHLWLVILFFGLLYFITAVCVAARRDVVDLSRAPSFTAVWSFLLFLGTSVYGQCTMASPGWNTHYNVGVFLGMVTLLPTYFFVVFCLFASFSNKSSLDADALLASFSFFLFVLFSIFSVVLTKNRALLATGDEPALPPTPTQPADV